MKTANGQMTAKKRGARSTEDLPVSPFARDFLELFYPVHYKIGVGIEDALRGGMFTRHQVAILWLIRSEGEKGRSISRKQIELSVTRWYELGNSAISKALRVLAKPPMSMLEIRDHPDSGRERQVVLTAKGVKEIDRMVERGRSFIQTMVDYLEPTESDAGVHFLSRVSQIIDDIDPRAIARPRAARATAKASKSTVRPAAASKKTSEKTDSAKSARKDRQSNKKTLPRRPKASD